ncbi:hypothetical protein KAU32_02075 [bacterium]|nr:hypothetical protein [bacterium]
MIGKNDLLIFWISIIIFIASITAYIIIAQSKAQKKRYHTFTYINSIRKDLIRKLDNLETAIEINTLVKEYQEMKLEDSWGKEIYINISQGVIIIQSSGPNKIIEDINTICDDIFLFIDARKYPL